MNRGLRCVHQSDPFLDTPVSTGLTKEEMKIIFQLNKEGMNMLKYLFKHGYEYDGKFLIKMKEYLDIMDLRSNKSFYNGISDLIKWDIIAKSEDANFYYINHKYFPK
jgi:hypothetical protein